MTLAKPKCEINILKYKMALCYTVLDEIIYRYEKQNKMACIFTLFLQILKVEAAVSVQEQYLKNSHMFTLNLRPGR